MVVGQQKAHASRAQRPRGVRVRVLQHRGCVFAVDVRFQVPLTEPRQTGEAKSLSGSAQREQHAVKYVRGRQLLRVYPPARMAERGRSGLQLVFADTEGHAALQLECALPFLVGAVRLKALELLSIQIHTPHDRSEGGEVHL